MGWFDEPKTDKGATFNLMAALDVRRVKVYFSGGNDEGGVDDIRVYRGEQKIEGEIGRYYRGDSAKPTKEQSLAELVGRPVYDEYSTFAGEFYVDGVVIWNLADRTVKMTGEETEQNGVGFDKEL